MNFWPRLLVSLLCFVGPWSMVYRLAYACGHEGWYAGAGYTQLLQFTPDNQLTAAGGTPPKVDWDTRWGAHTRVGYDFCASRWGVEIPLSFDRQRLNRREVINQIGIDANAIFHILETAGGSDFYWMAGGGMNIAMEGPVNNNTGAGGINFNFGPGFNYFIKQSKTKVAVGVSLPFKYTLYFRNNLSGSKKTTVFGFPFRVGFSIGF